ncbi:hypothetical protein AH2_00024 [Burkholderia phage vB_BceS_AH2]|uniref:Uncharacterized protein n=1 Tax=Burkholderia phage vB_BceS_AH2 TaxID=1133022 RepID=I6NTL6_9CAUD|nr:hypothetical protein B613_gp24 [Burkholderia phage vB_BceS_AH2]AEY69534.1 hypothetical protein AH2_00024 [Burkholderia phage vB_BceS_AH2]
MKTIEMTIPYEAHPLGGMEVRGNIDVLAKLRNAGIPVEGNISIQRVEHGTLEIITDRAFGDVVYRWTPDPDYDPAGDL